MIPAHITVELLKEIEACPNQVDQFRVLFPDGRMEVTQENLIACFRSGLEVDWVLQALDIEPWCDYQSTEVRLELSTYRTGVFKVVLKAIRCLDDGLLPRQSSSTAEGLYNEARRNIYGLAHALMLFWISRHACELAAAMFAVVEPHLEPLEETG